MADILQLEEFYLQRMHVEFHPGDPIKESDVSGADRLSLDYEVLYNSEAPDQWALVLSVQIAPPEFDDEPGYELDAEMFGFFDTSGVDPDEREYLIRLNGATILYGILRGQVATLSGTFPGGRLLLPTVDMNEVVNRIEARKVAELEAELERLAKPARASKAKRKPKSKAKAKSKPKSKAKPAAKKGH